MPIQRGFAFIVLLAGFTATCSFAGGSAVSEVNGKAEFSAGSLNLPPGSDFILRAAGTLTLPLSDQFGLQGDLTLATGNASSGALHLFTRDPSSYLAGGTIGFVATPGTTILAAGPEGELYFDRLSLEGWVGIAFAGHDPAATPATTGAFAIVDVAYYPDDDWRLDTGATFLDGYSSLHIGSEYLFHSFPQPVSLSLEGQLGSDGSFSALAGLKFYFGGADKSLIRRHREDDPQNRGVDLSNAAARTAPASTGASHEPPPSSDPPPDDNPDPPVSCDPTDWTGQPCGL